MGAGLVVLDEGKRKVVTGVGVSYDQTHQVDAFGRLRVSNPANIFEFKFNTTISFDYYFSQRNTSGGTQAQLTDIPARQLSVTSTAGSTSVIQSRRYIEYTVGKSQQIFFTGNFKGGVSGVSKCYGAYSDSNGVFFKLNGTSPEVVVRSYTSGSVVDTPVIRSNWNGDKLDGTGLSGETIDFTKEILFSIDYAWLGIGDIRFGVFINSKFIIMHTVQSSNILTTAYSQSGNLPMRAEVINVSGAATNMTITCMSVAVEGDAKVTGRVRNGNTGITSIAFNATETFIFGIRLGSTLEHSSIKVNDFRLLPDSGNTQAIWRIYYNPTLTGETWSAIPNSIAEQVSTPPSSFSGGLLIASGYITLDKIGSPQSDAFALTDIFTGRDIDGVADPIILTIQTIGGNGSSNFSGTWREYL